MLEISFYLILLWRYLLMSTFCHGVASAQTLDKSGEIVDIRGMDITSLSRTGILNYEHKSDIPGQVCGKILTAKKIFSKSDCSNEHELYFWDKCRVPLVYIIAELLDDYCQSGKDAAGILRYDYDKRNGNESAIFGFSIEGSEIPNSRGTNKAVISRGIARKVTLTSSPCNLLCIAELLVEKKESIVAQDFDSIFKSNEEAIKLFKSGEGLKIYEDYLAKKEPETIKKCSLHKSEPSQGLPSGWKTSVTQHPKLGSVVSMAHSQHGTVTAHKNPENNKFEVSHAGKIAGIMGKKGVFDSQKDAVLHAQKYVHALHQGKVVGRTLTNISSSPNLNKALEAGSTNAAPSTLVNGAAYQVESMGNSKSNTDAEDHKFHGTKKKDWNKRAKEEYERWPHKEKFEAFMKARMPHLHDGEIRAIGRAISLKKSVDFEKSLEVLVKNRK